MHRQENDFGLATQTAELLDRVQAIQQRHRDIRHDHIRLKPHGGLDQCPAILYDFDQLIGRFQEAAQPLGHHAMVIGD